MSINVISAHSDVINIIRTAVQSTAIIHRRKQRQITT